jgi:hypothetical protein
MREGGCGRCHNGTDSRLLLLVLVPELVELVLQLMRSRVLIMSPMFGVEHTLSLSVVCSLVD